jgi:hypothetical protein
MKQEPPAPPPGDVRIVLLPMFEPFIPVPVVVELGAREGWAAFVAAVRDGDRTNPLT